MAPSLLGWGSPPHLTQLSQSLTGMQRPISQAILDFVRLTANYHTNDRKFYEISRDLEGQINMGRSEILLEVCFKLGTQLLRSENA